MKDIDQKQLRALLDYNQENGLFFWLNSSGRSGRIAAGSVAGSVDKTTGYRQIKLGGKRYLQHRLAYFYTTGHWPVHEIDHINAERTDNRWCNLRHVDRKTNAQNIRKPHKDNKLGVQGVRMLPSGRFSAECGGFSKKSKYIGTFDTSEAAYAAYLAAKRETHAGATI